MGCKKSEAGRPSEPETTRRRLDPSFFPVFLPANPSSFKLPFFLHTSPSSSFPPPYSPSCHPSSFDLPSFIHSFVSSSCERCLAPYFKDTSASYQLFPIVDSNWVPIGVFSPPRYRGMGKLIRVTEASMEILRHLKKVLLNVCMRVQNYNTMTLFDS